MGFYGSKLRHDAPYGIPVHEKNMEDQHISDQGSKRYYQTTQRWSLYVSDLPSRRAA